MSENRHENPVICDIKIENNVHKVFLKSSGGNNRRWAKRYERMIQYHTFLKENCSNETDKARLQGYEMCMKSFLIDD